MQSRQQTLHNKLGAQVQPSNALNHFRLQVFLS